MYIYIILYIYIYIYNSGADVGGNIHKELNDPTNNLGANYSMTAGAYRSNPGVVFHLPSNYPASDPNTFSIQLDHMKKNTNEIKSLIDKRILETITYVCNFRKNLDSKFSFCK